MRKHVGISILIIVMMAPITLPQVTSSIVTPGSPNLEKATYDGCAGGNEDPPVSNAAFENQLFALVNAERTSHSLTPLLYNEDLSRGARYHGVDMAVDDYFDHHSWDLQGSTHIKACDWNVRLDNFYSGTWYKIGENIAAGQTSPDEAMTDWMNSPDHRANILDPDFTEIGIGYVYDAGSTYFHYWIQDFAKGPSLPVELMHFNVTLQVNRALLSWSTASESNNLGFYIQHLSANSYEDLAFIPGHGTSNELHSYGYRSNILPPGDHIFRLKQVDTDGSTSFSQEQSVEIPFTNEIEILPAYPNPFNGTSRFTVITKETIMASIEFYDQLGRHVSRLYNGLLEQDIPYTFAIDARDWPSGIYFYTVRSAHMSQSHKLLLIR